MFENNKEQKSGGSGDMMNIMGLWENTDKRASAGEASQVTPSPTQAAPKAAPEKEDDIPF